MPTVKLSRQFYERLGDKLVNELVELLNQVDTASRTELREQNELNFARFDAKLEQRLAAFEVKLEQRLDQQNRLFILAWVTQIATIIGLGLR